MFIPSGRLKVVRIAAIFVIITVILSLIYLRPSLQRNKYKYTDGKTNLGPTWRENVLSQGLSTEGAYLANLMRKHGLTKDIPFSSIRIRTSQLPGTPSMIEMKPKFMPDGLKRVRVDVENLQLKTEKHLQLTSSKSSMPDNINASSLLFGISTTYSRITYSNHSMIADWQRWFTNGKGKSNGASLMLVLHHASPSETQDVLGKLVSIGIDVTVVTSVDGRDMTTRYIHMIRELAHRVTALSKEGKEKRYLALVDDEVFFPNMGHLLDKLSNYNHRKEYYIGAPSERPDWVIERNSTTTYGGGAVFLTPPAADTLSRLPCLKNAEKVSITQWDLLLRECVTKHTSLDMHILTSFYNPRDNVSVLAPPYEAGISPLALHHYRSRHRFPPGKAHLVTSICGEECFLQRYKFRDNWVLVNGYSISEYPDGIDVTSTRKRKGKALVVRPDHRETQLLGVGRRLIVDPPPANERKLVTPRGRKRSWRFLDSAVAENGEVWQAYVKRRTSTTDRIDGDERLESDIVRTKEEPSEVDSVIVLIWEP